MFVLFLIFNTLVAYAWKLESSKNPESFQPFYFIACFWVLCEKKTFAFGLSFCFQRWNYTHVTHCHTMALAIKTSSRVRTIIVIRHIFKCKQTRDEKRPNETFENYARTEFKYNIHNSPLNVVWRCKMNFCREPRQIEVHSSKPQLQQNVFRKKTEFFFISHIYFCIHLKKLSAISVSKHIQQRRCRQHLYFFTA